jgi:hypothetical protein
MTGPGSPITLVAPYAIPPRMTATAVTTATVKSLLVRPVRIA